MPTLQNSITNTLRLISAIAACLAPAQTLHFEAQTLATDLIGGYQVIAVDMNNDGKPDLIALASGMRELVWYENPTWQRHVIATGLTHMINVAAYDYDGCGIPELALASAFSQNFAQSIGKVAILHHKGDPRDPWEIKEIDQLPTSHRLRWANIDGSGHKVLINAPLTSIDGHNVPLVYYDPTNWRRQFIGTAEQGPQHGIFITDWDHHGRDAILIGSSAGIHLYRYAKNNQWTRSEIAASPNSDITIGHLKRERFLAGIEPWHGNQVVVYRQSHKQWQREVIDDSLLDAHTILTADFDHSGSDQILAGFRGKPYGVYIYKFDGRQWSRQTLDLTGISAAGCALINLDVACIGSATHNLKLYRVSKRGHSGLP